MFNSALKQQLAQEYQDQCKTNDLLAQTLTAQAEWIAELQKQVKKLKKQLKSVDETLLPYKDPQPTSFLGNQPLFVTEEEEDARYQFDAGFIDKKELAQTLADIGLDSSLEVL